MEKQKSVADGGDWYVFPAERAQWRTEAAALPDSHAAIWSERAIRLLDALDLAETNIALVTDQVEYEWGRIAALQVALAAQRATARHQRHNHARRCR